MSNIVIQLSKEMQQALHQAYDAYAVIRNAPGVLFAAKLPDAAITSYKSGKVMFQGAQAQREAAKWGEATTAPINKTVSKGDELPPHFEKLSVLGSDETGTGDYFGPITVAAVYVPENRIELVKELGVKDSKMLTDTYMRSIANDLKAALPHHCVLTLHNDKYNKVQAQGWSQGKMKAVLHNQALRTVLTKLDTQPDAILIDQFAQRSTYFNYLKEENNVVNKNVLFATKAEQLHVAVAAASILARNAFLDEMDRLSKDVGITLPKGAGKVVDETGAKILLAQGEDALRKVTKWHFANTTKSSKIASKARFI